MFFDRFEDFCKSRGITANRACIDMGLSRSIAAKWKNTGATPSGEVLSKISNYFDTTVDFLLTGEQIERIPIDADITFDDFTYAMANEADGLSDERKQQLLDLARFFKPELDKEKRE